MKDLPVVRSASFGEKDVTTSGLSRRGFLMGVSAVGGLALAAAARAGINYDDGPICQVGALWQ